MLTMAGFHWSLAIFWVNEWTLDSAFSETRIYFWKSKMITININDNRFFRYWFTFLRSTFVYAVGMLRREQILKDCFKLSMWKWSLLCKIALFVFYSCRSMCIRAVEVLRCEQILRLVQVVCVVRGQLRAARMLHPKHHQLQHTVSTWTLAPDGRSASLLATSVT